MARHTKTPDPIINVERPNSIARVVASRLQEERKKAGLTSTELAELAGVSTNYIYGLEYGTTNPTLKTLDQIVTALKIDIRDLFPGPVTAPPSNSDLKRLSRTLDGIVLLLKQHMADDQELFEREVNRRAKDTATILNEIKAIVALRDDLGNLADGAKKNK